ncbi:ArnT family glycosyltransferase, partial [Candidatus Bipolaricaulota bacterium]
MGKIPLWVLPLIIALLLLPVRSVETSPDASWYLANALRITIGDGYDVLIRGPAFPLMLAGGFRVFGVSVWSGMLIVRLFFVLNVLIVYALGTRLFGRVVGLGASLLTLSSFAFANASSFLLLDGVFPFFVLLGIYLTVISLDEEAWAWPILAGLSFAIGFLTKEVALLYLIGLPPMLVLVVKKYRTRRCVLRAVLILLVGLVAIAPWAAHVWRSTGSLGLLLGRGSVKAIDTLLGSAGVGSSSLFARAGDWLLAVPNYFVNEIVPAFSIWPLVALAWFVGAVLAIRVDRYRTLVLSGLLFLPLVLYLGSKDLRLGQGVLFFLITYILVSAVLRETITFLFARTKLKTRWSTLISLMLVLALAGAQCGVGNNSSATVWKESSLVIRYLLGLPTDWQTSGWHSK